MSGPLLGFASAGLALGAGVAWWRGLRAVRLEGRRPTFLVLFALAGLLGLAAFAAGPGLAGGSAAALGLLAAGVFCGLAAFSGQERRTPAVRVGGPILDFTAPDAEGRPFALSSLRGRPFLLKFFRGHW